MTVDTIKVASSFPPGTTTALTTANFRPIHLHVVTVMYTAGLTTIIPDPLFNPQAFISTALKHRPLFAGFVPAQLRLILTLAGQQNLTFPSFRSVSAGGDVITADILHTARSLFPNAMLRTGLGMTETYTLAFAKYDLGAPIAALSNGVVSLGAPNAGIVLRVTAHETFHPVKRGETGDLWVAGQTVLEGYLDGRDAESFRAARDLAGRERRWFRTGDWALIDEKGELYVLGRYKDIVVRGGVNLSPVAVETALGKLGLEDAQVVGVPHGIHGSVPVAVVADLRGKDKGKVVESVVGMLGAEYRLEGVWTLEEVGLKEWVYNSTGKISKTDLQKVLRETVLRETGSRESVL
ncbi:acetyl-CoA synthetase-like protein [Myriangium duriaei CBS 260.36]|uniref:Acetyl-CoA synthetase-like protein n=1 Tax=Myriangium duriaei CBS 260.36 TaxID=1168546 RepID=A0A9P4IUE6_9PEZI|nr:acetyl-CoA synthetase-like protein [Myriangium duriaei CBS 260.36]